MIQFSIRVVVSSRSSAFPPRPDGPARTELVMSERIDSSISTFSEQPGQSPTWAITSSRTSCTFECSLGEVFDEFVSNVRTRDLPKCSREEKVQKFTRTITLRHFQTKYFNLEHSRRSLVKTSSKTETFLDKLLQDLFLL